MQRLSLSYFYDLGAALRPIRDLKAGTLVDDVWMESWMAQASIDQLLAAQIFWGTLKSSYALGQTLVQALAAFREKTMFGQPITVTDAFPVTQAYAAYENVLRAELSVADAYFVTPKGGYDSLALINNASVLFPADLAFKVPESISEIKEAGKCLAFELCTAAGIHALRALELVLKAYYDAVTNGAALPGNRNLGAYLKKLEDLEVGDPKVIAALTQIKDLHRNPLMHPEETLDKDSAIGLLGIVISAVSAMLLEIPKKGALSLADGPS